MKYLAILTVMFVIYFVITRASPVDSAKEAITQADAAPITQVASASTTTASTAAAPSPGTALKRPFDRTHEVLTQVKARNGAGEF